MTLRTPSRKRGRKPRAIVRLTGRALEKLRRDCYERDGFGVCQDQTSPKCWKWASWQHGEMAHIVSRGAGGSDVLSNVRWTCRECHRFEHNGGKPCPPKPKKELV